MTHPSHWSRGLAGGLLLAQAVQRPESDETGASEEMAAERSDQQARLPKKEFTFARLVFRGGSGWRFGAWATDAPKADVPFYPEKYSSAAYRLGINTIIYSMTH